MKERFPGELETLRADNARLRRLLELSEEQARGARPDQATLTGAPTTPVSKQSPFHDKVRFYIDLFRCRSDVYAIRSEIGATADPAGCPLSAAATGAKA